MAATAEPSLVALAMSGDDKAFEEFVRRRQGAIRRLMHRLSGDWAIGGGVGLTLFLKTRL
jgi:hypothetical protein